MGGRHKIDTKSWAHYIVAFGLGLLLSCFCPMGLIMLLASIIIITLGIALFKGC
ncbi:MULTISPECIES: hypothetical protein [Acutalibacteraceae]|uniref:hypothetical protein n=1 Tax=Acutalibacteraceae TaxID=3082771 RepID=UPI0013E8EA03|nr:MULTISPECIES: hypothetical protein [Acutalibacteraceae]